MNIISGDLLNVVLDRYAIKLDKQKNYVSAGLLWTKCNKLDSAIAAYQKCGHWRKVMYLAAKQKRSPEETKKLASEMAEELQNYFNFEEAAVIYDQYLNDCDTAVSCAIKGTNFEEAIRIAYKYGADHLVESEIVPAILQSYTENLARITTKAKQYRERYNRLLTLRHQKLTAPKEDPDAIEDWANNDTASAYSQESLASQQSAQTWASRGTVSSRASNAQRGRGKKKPQKKKHSGRQGNPFEQEYLITELANSIPSKRWQEQIKDLLRLLLSFDEREKCAKLQTAFRNYISLVKSGMPLLNTPKVLNTEEEEQAKAQELRRQEQIHPLLIHPTTTVRHEIEDVKWETDLI